MQTFTLATALIACFAPFSGALTLDPKNHDSIKQTSLALTQSIFNYYNASSSIGQFNQPAPWQWWQSGFTWNSLINYQLYTNDTQYQSHILNSLVINLGPLNDLVSPDQVGWEANDDQAYWLFAYLTAMEYGFEDLPTQYPYLKVAENVFNLFVQRWGLDSGTCAGGLKWQYNQDLAGFFYKNTVSNGGFFQTAARLARYTGDPVYAQWANTIWDWLTRIGLIDTEYFVYDGSADQESLNCSQLDHHEWTYNMATLLHGAGHMYAYTKLTGNDTNQPDWEARVHGLLERSSDFFTPLPNATNVMFEVECEPTNACDKDSVIFKAILANWLAKVAILVPSTAATIAPYLTSSAVAAASVCTGLGNNTCGYHWGWAQWDGANFPGAQVAALDVVQSLLANDAPPLKTLIPIKAVNTSSEGPDPVLSSSPSSSSQSPGQSGTSNASPLTQAQESQMMILLALLFVAFSVNFF